MFEAEQYVRPGPTRGADGFYHPTSEAELVALVRRARREGRQLRVRGSAHSVARAIECDGSGHFHVLLDRYTNVQWDNEHGLVTVAAGCRLGEDPRDKSGQATRERSLCAQLEARGWALPDLGGVSHQTVSGFLSTGSCGGSVRHSLEPAIVAYRLIDGSGRVRELRVGDEHFHAVGCSLGVLGILSSVTLQCVPRYDIMGSERICSEEALPFDLFGDGDAGLEGFLRTTEYARLFWWPHAGLRRVTTWQAKRLQGPLPGREPKPYSVLGDGIRNPRLALRESGEPSSGRPLL